MGKAIGEWTGQMTNREPTKPIEYATLEEFGTKLEQLIRYLRAWGMREAVKELSEFREGKRQLERGQLKKLMSTIQQTQRLAQMMGSYHEEKEASSPHRRRRRRSGGELMLFEELSELEWGIRAEEDEED